MDLAGGLKKSLDVRRGLFLIRYDSAEDASSPPRLVISSEGWTPSDLELILPPDADEPVLWSPGGCLVVRVGRPGRVIVTIVPAQPQGSTAAKVQLVSLSEDPLGRRSAGPVNLSELKILGHLSGIGDVRVASNEWLGGPAAPSRIEGIAVEMPQMSGAVRLRYSVSTGGSRPVTTTQMVDADAFAGTRGRALPLVGATLEIYGPGASRYMVVADALFLGSPVTWVSGQRVIVAGPTGREPLVGLRISIVDADHSAADAAEAGEALERPGTFDEKSGRLTKTAGKRAGTKPGGSMRVFRSRPADDKPDVSEPVAARDGEISAPAASKSKVKVFSREHLKVKRE
jgi:hypothetical protein